MNVSDSGLKCPGCGTAINFAARKCGACGFAFSEDAYKKLFFYFDLKNDFRNLIAVENSVSERLAKLSQKIRNYEQLLDADIREASSGAAGVQAAREETPQTAGEEGRAFDGGTGRQEPLAAPPSQAPRQPQPQQGPEATRQAVQGGESERQRVENQTPPGGPGSPKSAKSAFTPSSGVSEAKKAFESRKSDSRQAPRDGRAQAPAAPSADAEGDFELIVGQKWMLIVGIVTIVFGVGYFLKYSFERELIGPAGQVALAYLLGITFLGLGNFFHKKSGFANFGLYMIGGAIAVFYFAAFAAYQLYDPPVIDQGFSFLIMVMITVLACALALRFDVKWLAVLGLVGGFLTPVLVSSGRDNFYGLMGYMTLLNFGVLSVAFKKNWNLLNALGFIGTYILYSGWYAKYYTDERFWGAILFVNLFYFIYSIAPFAYQFLKNQTESSPFAGFAVMTLNSFIGFGYSYNMINAHFGASYYVSVVTVFYAAVFLGMASHLFKQGKRFADAFVVTLALASLFLIITIPMIFSNHWVTFFWAVQAFTLLLMAAKLNRGAVYAGAYVLFAIALFKLFIIDYPAPGVFHLDTDMMRIEPRFTYLIVDRYIAWAGVLTMLFAAAGVARKHGVMQIVSDVKDSTILYIIFGICLFIALNIETASFFFDYLPAARFAFISGLWACFAAALMVIGFAFNKYGVRKTAIALFLMTLIKVFLFDMGNMSTPWRILSFMVLGLIMVVVSFYYHKFKDRLLAALNEEGRK